MVESRWIRRAGPGFVTLGAVALVASTTLGAAGRPWVPPPCAGPPVVPAATERASATAWFREDPHLVDGALRGMRVTLGLAGDARARSIALDAESFAAGPFGDTVLVGTDDGRQSRLSLVDVARGCAWSIATEDDVIRRATITPDGSAVIEMRVDRSTREDLGIWRRPLVGGADAESVVALGPLEPDARFGRTFATAFTWSADGRALAVRSCGEAACRVRILELATGRHRLIADPAFGDVVGLTADRLVVRGACRGLPCPIVSLPLGAGAPVVLDQAAGIAALISLPDGTSRVVLESGPGGRRVRSVSLDGRAATDLGPLPAGQRLVPADGSSASAAALPAGRVALGIGGRVPSDGSVPALVLQEASE